MLNEKLDLNQDLFQKSVKKQSPRDGFGISISEISEKNPDIFALCADLTESVRLKDFESKYPDRFIQTGIAEQNMAGISAGLALSGKIPFMVSHAIFSPSRNWDQIRMAISFSDTNVKIVGSHSGFSNGMDGGVAQSLEDIALMRVLPNMVVINPIDAIQTQAAVKEISKYKGPVYLRISKADTPLITTEKTPFAIGKAYTLIEGTDLTLIATGNIMSEALLAAKTLKTLHKINLEVISLPTIKPLDEKTIIDSAKKTGIVITLEEHQIQGGMGSAIAELLSEKHPTKVIRMGMNNEYACSGTYEELKDKYGVSEHHIVDRVLKELKEKK